MAASGSNAIDMLKADHRAVERLFAQFDAADGDARAQADLASRIGQALAIHAELEESLLYPRLFKRLNEDGVDLVCEATVEHGTLHGLIADMNGRDPGDPMVKARVVVLKEYVKHHVREEENELFPKVEDSGLDLDAIGDEMAQMRRALEARVDAEPDGTHIRITETWG